MQINKYTRMYRFLVGSAYKKHKIKMMFCVSYPLYINIYLLLEAKTYTRQDMYYIKRVRMFPKPLRLTLYMIIFT